MKRTLILLSLIAWATSALGDDAVWSNPVNGLVDCWYCHLRGLTRHFVASSLNSRMSMTSQARRGFDFSRDKLSLQVADKDGKGLSLANGPYDGKSPLWEVIALPYAGSASLCTRRAKTHARDGRRQVLQIRSTGAHMTEAQRPPLPPFDTDSARTKVRMAEDAWNARDPQRVSLAYSPDSIWRNRAEFLQGREAIVQFLTRKWAKELDYRLIKELWAYHGNRIAV